MTARRIGAQEVTILYRRTRAEMPANEWEIEEAEEEGIQFQFLASPIEVLGKGDMLAALRCQRMQLGEPDDSGRRRPIPIEGDTFDLPVDTVIMAIGQTLDDDHRRRRAHAPRLDRGRPGDAADQPARRVCRRRRGQRPGLGGRGRGPGASRRRVDPSLPAWARTWPWAAAPSRWTSRTSTITIPPSGTAARGWRCRTGPSPSEASFDEVNLGFDRGTGHRRSQALPVLRRLLRVYGLRARLRARARRSHDAGRADRHRRRRDRRRHRL